MRTLDERGYPINPRSIFISVRREHIPTTDDIIQALLYKDRVLCIQFKDHGQWSILYGTVTGVLRFYDGWIVFYPQLDCSPLKWNDSVLWISFEGQSGILK